MGKLHPVALRYKAGDTSLKSEHEEQVDFAQTLDILKIPFFAVPNGIYLPVPKFITGKSRELMLRSVKTVIGKMKAEGMKVGVSDMFIMVPSGKYHGMFLEMKTDKGVVSVHQKSFIKTAEDQGYKCVVAYGAIEAYKKLTEYINNP